MRLRICALLHKSVTNDSRVRREAEALHDAGYAVTVVELAPEGPPLRHMRRVSALPPAWVRPRLGVQAYRVAFTAMFVARGLRQRPDVVHAHDAAMLLPGLVLAKLARARLVYDSHELATGVPYRERGWGRFVEELERRLLPHCAAVITVSDGIAERLQSKYGLAERPAVLRNVCSLPRGRAPVGLRARLQIGDAPLVLHQGAAATDRGCDVLLKAVAKLPGVHLCFLGGGDEATVERLRIERAAFGVEDRVHFVESVPPERLLDLTADADVGVSLLQDTCDNHRLALPNKLFEYLAAGVPVVTSDLPQMGALVREWDVGWTADPADAESVVRALEEALAHRADPGLAARVRAAADAHAWDGERRVLLGVYVRIG